MKTRITTLIVLFISFLLQAEPSNKGNISYTGLNSNIYDCVAFSNTNKFPNSTTTANSPLKTTSFNSFVTEISFTTEFNVVNENSASVAIILGITEPSASSIDVMLTVSTTNGTASSGNQFSFTDQLITIPANATTHTVTIPITNNTVFNGDSYFVLNLSNPNGASLGAITQKAVYIIDDETNAPAGNASLNINYLASYLVDATGSAEIVAHDPVTQRLFVMNSTASKIEILDFSNPLAITNIQSVDLLPYGIGGTSIAVRNGIVVATVEGANFTNGKVVFMNTNGAIGSVVEAGVLPDMVTFTPDGTKVLTANEGQPNDDYTIDPEGSISIINITGDYTTVMQSDVTNLNFNAFDSQLANLKANNVRIYGLNASVSRDVEPEYITIAADGLTAWVSLQENNALATIDLVNNQITAITPLGFKDLNVTENAFDSSDQFTGIFMGNWPVKGMYMPDAIANYTVNGTTYIVTANEGDSRDYGGFSEEVRISNTSYVLDPTVFPNASFLKKNRNLGRLTVSNATGDIDNDGDFDEIHVFGARSFSIWNATTGALVYDSASDFERITASDPTFGALFNTSNDNNNPKNRSDNKGPEPEGITVAEINGATYAFITLERIGGLMTYDITNPMAPIFVSYKNSRNTTALGGDLGPEGIIYIAPQNSPTGKGLVIMANEVSATLSMYEITNDVLSNENFTTETNSFIAYPNPVKNGMIYFTKPETVRLYDNLGRKIIEKENTLNLEMNYSKGIYFIQTKNGVTQKIVIE